MTLRFGTDGLRGVANTELTPELVLALGRAAARVLGQKGSPFLIGRDTRLSGPMLEAALAAGMASEGVNVGLLGVLPTPGVAWLSAADGWPAAMISASHNPYADNGVKFFAPGGRKLSDETEKQLEAEVEALGSPGLSGTQVGRVAPCAGVERYQDALVSTLAHRRLDGLRVIVDCANGAASEVAPAVLARAGADVDAIHNRPDGININDGSGSTHPRALQEAVVATGADAGLAFDGDADRVLAVDHAGELVDGDQLMAICAVDRRDRGLLVGDTVVVTVMTNLGFRLAMRDHAVSVVETAVGDRSVLEALEQGGWTLGGEQSGHVVFRDLATTGDGILTALQVLDTVARSGRPLAELAAVMTRLPQVLRSVRVPARVADRDGLDHAEQLRAEVRAVEAELGDRGRVLIRPSGTEPVVRVMVEAASAEQADEAADRLCEAVAAALGRPSDSDH